MKLALCQMRMTEKVAENEDKSIKMFKKAVSLGADLILFPEIQLCSFFPQYEKQNVSSYEMKIDAPFIKELQRICKEHSVMAAPNIYLSENGKTYDATILIGEDGFFVFDTKYGKIGIVICFDRHYPESIRTESLMNADLILIPTANTKSEPLEMFEWEVRVQAFQNSVAIAMCNRVGLEDEMDFAGESLICDANGNIIEKANEEEQILIAEIDLSKSGDIRKNRPYTNLRRIECYR